MNAATFAVHQSAADAAFPTRQVIRDSHGERLAISRLRELETVVLATTGASTRVTIELTPLLALELSTALRRQAETLQREIAARMAVGGAP